MKERRTFEFSDGKWREVEHKEETRRTSVIFPARCLAYLKEAAWRERSSVTRYLTSLVEADMEKHAEE